MTSVLVRGTPWRRRTEGLYVQVGGRTYNGHPVYQRRDFKGRRWSLYHKNRGMWVLDFNRVSPWWSGTVAFSSFNPRGHGGILEAEWPLFNVDIEAAPSTSDAIMNVQQAQSKLEAQPQLVLYKLNASLLAPDGEVPDHNYTDEDEEDELAAEDGDLMTIAQPAWLVNGTLPEDTSPDGDAFEDWIIIIASASGAALLIVVALTTVGLLYIRSRKAKRLAAGKAGSSTKSFGNRYSATDMVQVSIVSSPPAPSVHQEAYGVHGPLSKI